MGGAGSASLRNQNRIAVPKLTVAVIAPALHRAVLKERAGMFVSRGNSSRRRDSIDGHRYARPGRGSVAELTDFVHAPALDGAVPKNRAGVEAAGRAFLDVDIWKATVAYHYDAHAIVRALEKLDVRREILGHQVVVR